MEAFSLLKYWRAAGGNGEERSDSGHNSETTTIITAVDRPHDETDDDGPFFDMEFSVPDEEETENGGDESDELGLEGSGEEEEEEEEEEGRFKFTLSSCSNGGQSEPNPSLSSSDDLFVNGKLVPVESSVEASSKHHFPVSLLKSATKFRVFVMGLKKFRSGTVDIPQSIESSRSSSKLQKQSHPEDSSSSEEKRFSKEVMRRYLNRVKPFYIRVSKQYGEKLRLFSGESDEKNQKQGNIPARLRVVCKHLGKSRSASSAAVAAAPPPVPVSSRRDDSLLLQEEGVQSAILHCKRSLNSSTDRNAASLSRSASDATREESEDSWRNSSGDGKELGDGH